MSECTHHWTMTSECPQCLRAEIERLRADLKHQCELNDAAGEDLDRLRARLAEAERERDALRELLRDAQNYAIDASDRPGATNAYKQAAKDCWERIDAALESKS